MSYSRTARATLVLAVVAGLTTIPLAANAASVVSGGSSGRSLSAELLGANEVGPAGGDPDGSGTANVTVNVGKGELCYSVSFRNIATPLFGHIHDADAGDNGGVVVTLAAIAGAQGGVAAGCATVDRALLRDIVKDPSGYYVNVHTAEFPAGAIRGQLGR